MDNPPSSILILGHGVFGLSTALSLCLRPLFKNTTITILDRSPFPSPDGSSIDTSRIVRSDYSDPLYAVLAAEAMTIWRSSSTCPLPEETHGKVANTLSGLGEEGRYTQTGLALLCNTKAQGSEYVRKSFENMKDMSASQDVHELKDEREIEKVIGTGGRIGDWGYVNKSSGWADAEACMRFLHSKIQSLNRVKFITGEAVSLIHSPAPMSQPKIEGILLSTGERIFADLTILATGAWTGSMVDLRGRATATGQALTYLPISTSQQATLSKMPVVLNMSTGMFIIPPPSPSTSSSTSPSSSSQNILKVARHGYGYTNPVTIPTSNLTFSSADEKSHAGNKLTISLPRTKYNDPTLHVPLEGQRSCLDFLSKVFPYLIPSPPSTTTKPTSPPNHLPPFTASKICWYNDTPTGDFLICQHPSYNGLFLATGGSGHGFKFLPVIGERIVDVLMKEGRGWVDFGGQQGQWRWRERIREDEVVTEDGSRGGKRGLVLDVELSKGTKMGRGESRL